MDSIMNFLSAAIDLFLHLNVKLPELLDKYGLLACLLIFLIIFCETGLVVTPFLPGDSLLFAAGAISALPNSPLNFWLAFFLILVAAFTGNTLNYFIGKSIGQKIIDKGKNRIIKKKYIDNAHSFYEKHGGVAVILSRFVPVVRTFAPFVAGIGKMSFSRYSIYNLIGGASWITLFMTVGYFFGNIKFIQDNFELVILGIIFVSILPMIFPWVKSKFKKKTPTE